MEKFNNIYEWISCEKSKHIPQEVEAMYFDQYGQASKKSFCKLVRRQVSK